MLAPTVVVFGYFHYVDVGRDGRAVPLDETNVTDAGTLIAPNTVRSSGWFAGASGQTIRWTATSWISPGSSVYQTRLDFETEIAFGDVRVISYLDEDVYGYSDDVLIVLGSGVNVQLLTLDGSRDVGVAQAAMGLLNVQYLGWAADKFADLRAAITGSGAVYDVAGVVDTTDLPPMFDPRYPNNPAYGLRDITTAFAFGLDPLANQASLIFALGGSPTGEPPMPIIPEPSTLVLVAIGVVASAPGLRRRA